MALNPGNKLGPYEIQAPLGAGGMGEVYRARDTRLDRTVAIKVLASHLASSPELKQRLEREARAISSLNHPNICHLYDIGSQDGADFLVMEVVEGQTLADRLRGGALPLPEIYKIGIEIADALDSAHRKGITHRDLKPGNIMLTQSGAKLLDFGLAKLRQDAGSPVSGLTTTQGDLSGQGAILGTLQYMAPEQVEGQDDQLDARTDIFAFGAVLYEMATGKKAFEGKSQASVIAKILEADPPPVSSLRPVAPPALDRVVRKCLAKEPEKRWQAASDLCDELKWIAEGSSQIAVAPASTRKGIGSLGRRAVVLGLVTLLLGAAIASLIWNLKPLSPQPVIRTVINLPSGQQLAGLDIGPAVALSPDGTHLVYVARQGGA